MKTRKELLKEEFEKYESKADYVETLEDLLSYIEIGIDDLEEGKKDIQKEKKFNVKAKLDGFLRNLLPFIYESEDIEFYDEDNRFVDEILTLTDMQIYYLEEISKNATEKNFKDLLKLVEFIVDYYNKNMDYLDNERVALEIRYKGYRMFNSKHEDTRQAVHEFFMETLDNYIENDEIIEKVKKI